MQSVNEELQTVNAELKHKLEEVSRAHSDLENLMAATEIATLFLDRALRIQRFTPELAELFNVQAGDRGRPITHLTRKLSYPTLEEDATRVLRTLVPIEHEARSESAGWFLVRLLPYRTVDDRIEGVVISFVDITSSKKAAEALRESEEQFRALVTASAQMVWTTDASGLVVDDSPSWRAFTGQSVEEWQGSGWVDALHPDDREHALSAWHQSVASNSPMEHEFRVYHRPSGKYRWTIVRAVPLREDDGSIRGWVAMNLDINERKEAEHSLRESEEHLRQSNETLEQRVAERTETLEQVNQQLVMTRDLFSSLFNANPIPTALTRLEDGMFLDANPAYLRFFDLQRDAVIGRTTSQLHAWLPPEAQAGLVEQVQREGNIRDLEIATSLPNGEQRVALFSMQRVWLDGTEAVILAFVDITERKKIEGSLREMNEMLQERTEQVQQLAASLSLAEQEERRRVSQVLHDDLQQLLYSLLMRLQMLLDRSATWDAELLTANVGRVTEQIKQAVRVTRSLVTELNPPVLDTEGLPRVLEWLAGHMEEMYGLKVEVSAEGTCEPRTTAMRTLLSQMTRELLFNVVKHAGAKHARVRVKRVEDELHLYVEDNGDGFDLTSLTTPYGEERGYGLQSIARRLELMGGRLALDSTPGDGTRVTLIVPCRNDEADNATRR